MALPSETASTMEAKIDGLRKLQDNTWKFTVTVHPEDMPAWLLASPMGTRLQLAIVEIGDDEQPLPHQEQEKPKRTWDDYSRAERAGILCNDEAFQRRLMFLYLAPDDEPLDEMPEQWCARVIRSECGVESRTELNTNPGAAARWDALEAEYRQATGRDAEERG